MSYYSYVQSYALPFLPLPPPPPAQAVTRLKFSVMERTRFGSASHGDFSVWSAESKKKLMTFSSHSGERERGRSEVRQRGGREGRGGKGDGY